MNSEMAYLSSSQTSIVWRLLWITIAQEALLKSLWNNRKFIYITLLYYIKRNFKQIFHDKVLTIFYGISDYFLNIYYVQEMSVEQSTEKHRFT